jgi:hypothetical protein
VVNINNKEEIKKYYESEMKNNPVFKDVMDRLSKL